MSEVLKGVRVVDLTRGPAGGLATMIMADFGADEPDMEVCWVPLCNWADFFEQVTDLLEAGYPGCIGCAGPGAEGEWNETSRRRQFNR